LVVGLHVSAVHTLVSAHSPSVLQQLATAAWPHAPVAVLHVSVVHGSESLQSAHTVQQLGFFV
jgi:hypothetical protein